MSVKTAAFLALVGTILVTVLMALDLVRDLTGIVGGLVPAASLFRSLIATFASLTATLFLFVFYKRQS